MRASKYSEKQIDTALRQAEAGTAIVDICRKMKEIWRSPRRRLIGGGKNTTTWA